MIDYWAEQTTEPAMAFIINNIIYETPSSCTNGGAKDLLVFYFVLYYK